jgi:hypothetical protein
MYFFIQQIYLNAHLPEEKAPAAPLERLYYLMVFYPPDAPPEHAFDVFQKLRIPSIYWSKNVSRHKYFRRILCVTLRVCLSIFNYVPEEHKVGRKTKPQNKRSRGATGADLATTECDGKISDDNFRYINTPFQSI